MREQTVKIVQKEKINIARDWTCNVTTVDSIVSENRGERYNMNLGKQNNRLSPVFNITELISSKLTLNL
jgi:hypothetical protein